MVEFNSIIDKTIKPAIVKDDIVYKIPCAAIGCDEYILMTSMFSEDQRKRLSKLKCPHCNKETERYITNVDDLAFEINESYKDWSLYDRFKKAWVLFWSIFFGGHNKAEIMLDGDQIEEITNVLLKHRGDKRC